VSGHSAVRGRLLVPSAWSRAVSPGGLAAAFAGGRL